MSSTTPPPGGPEFLEPDDGQPAERDPRDRGNGRRTVAVAGAAAVGLALVGGGVWAAMSFFATGTQPAEALPGSTLGYASLDLDPSGDQKIEAFRMIQKFPALERELDGLDADDDLLAKIFEGLEEECDAVDYDDDIKPWIGKRFAVAAVDLGEEQPTPVGVLQVSDAGAAGDGLSRLQQCAGSDVGGWAVDGEWAVVAETKDLADEVVAAAGESTLAEDSSFQEWTDEAGDAGVLTLYAAPAAGTHVAGLLQQSMNPLGGPLALLGEETMPPLDGELTPDQPDMPDEMRQALEAFGGMAATLRFDDGSLELEVAGSTGQDAAFTFAGGSALDSVGSLPDDTAVAFGVGLPDGWFDKALEQAGRLSEDVTVEDLLTELESDTGLTGDDIETLLGESVALAVGSDFDLETFFGSGDGSGLPIGAKIRGDATGIQEVLATLGDVTGPTPFLANDAEGDSVAVGPDQAYRQALLGDGALRDDAVFEAAVAEAEDAAAILFLNFNAGGWLDELTAGDPEAQENAEPLQGIGLSSWSEEDAVHAVFRLTTD